MIETERLILRRFNENDFNDLFEYLSEIKVHCFSSMKCKTIEEAKVILKDHMKNELCLAIALKDSNKVIGEIDFHGESTNEFGGEIDTYSPCWMLNEKYQGKGYMYEAAYNYIDYLFKNNNARRIYAYTEDYNISCQKLLAKLNFRVEGLYKEFVTFVNDEDGNPIYENTYEYAILKKEWK